MRSTSLTHRPAPGFDQRSSSNNTSFGLSFAPITKPPKLRTNFVVQPSIRTLQASKVDLRVPVKRKQRTSPGKSLGVKKASLKYHKMAKLEMRGTIHRAHDRSLQMREGSLDSILSGKDHQMENETTDILKEMRKNNQLQKEFIEN